MSGRPLSEQLARVLACYNDALGEVRADGRTQFGIDTEPSLCWRPPVHALPRPLCELILENYSVRISATTREADGQFLALPWVVIRWTPATEFHGSHRVVPAAAAAIDAAIMRMPSPSVVVHAGPERWVAWRVQQPITDAREAHGRCRRFAAALSAQPIEDLAAQSLPLAGPVRSWSRANLASRVNLDRG